MPTTCARFLLKHYLREISLQQKPDAGDFGEAAQAAPQADTTT